LAGLTRLKRLPLSALSCLNLAAEGPSHMGQLVQRGERHQDWPEKMLRSLCVHSCSFPSPSPFIRRLVTLVGPSCRTCLSDLLGREMGLHNFLLISLPMYLLLRIHIFEQHCTHGDSFRDIIWGIRWKHMSVQVQ